MRALWSDRPNCSHNVSQKVKRIRCFSHLERAHEVFFADIVALAQHGVAQAQTSFAQAHVTFWTLLVPRPKRHFAPPQDDCPTHNNQSPHYGPGECHTYHLRRNYSKIDSPNITTLHNLDGQNSQSPIASVQRARPTLAGHSVVPRGTNNTPMNANRAIRIAAQR